MDCSSNRRAPRRMIYFRGKIIFNGGSTHYDCTVRNISDGGAKILIDGFVALPEDFELFLPAMSQRRHVKLRWRQIDACGVSFRYAVKQAPADDHYTADHATEAVLRRRIIELEREVNCLNARLLECNCSRGWHFSLT